MAFPLIAEALHGGHEDCGGGAGSRDAHHDVDVFFRAEVGSEAAFVDDVVGEAQADLLRDDAAGAVGDIAERAGVDKSRRTFGGLDEVGKNGIGEEGHHSAGGIKVAARTGFRSRVAPMTMAARRRAGRSGLWRGRG